MSFTLALLTLPVFAADSGSTASETGGEHRAPVLHFATALIAPYQILDEDEALTGRTFPILECAMTKLGLDYDVELLPWGRAQKNVELGLSDAFFVASQNAVRDRYAKISEPLFSGTRSWFFKAGRQVKLDSDDGRQKAIVGTVFGTNMHSLLDTRFKNVVTKTTEKELLELLLVGRIDAVLLTDDMFSYTLEAMHLEDTLFSSEVASQRPLGVYFGRHYLDKHPGMIEHFNDALVDCVPSPGS